MSSMFLMKADTLDLTKEKNLRGDFLWSIKYDGMRAFWDGGRFNQNNPLSSKATGLWTINGNPIFAPKWWLDRLPPFALDGELWLGVGRFHDTISVCRSHTPDDRWEQMALMAYDSPHFEEMFNHRIAKVTGGKELRIDQNLRNHYAGYSAIGFSSLRSVMGNEIYTIVKQNPFRFEDWEQFETDVLDPLIETGHEGVVFRKVGAIWEPKRSKNLLKHKPYIDAEGTIVGYKGGARTDKDSRWFGAMGSLLVKWEGKQFAVGGFNAQDRILEGDNIKKFDGVEVPEHVYSERFPRGSKITFKYRTTTDDGIPREARYHRIYLEEE